MKLQIKTKHHRIQNIHTFLVILEWSYNENKMRKYKEIEFKETKCVTKYS